MVGKKKLLQIIIVFILIVLIVIAFYPYIAEMLDLYNPLLEGKYKLVRYYACSLAICTKGCGKTEVGNICVDYDAVKRECKDGGTCQDICDDQFGGSSEPGEFCGENYKINLPLENKVRLKGVYKVKDWIGTEEKEMPAPMGLFIEPIRKITGMIWAVLRGHYFAEVHYIIKHIIHKNEPDFPEPSEIIEDDCMKIDGARYYLGVIHKDTIKPGAGCILVLPTQASEKFKCFGYDNDEGYDECEFIGNLDIWSFENPDKEGCADVIIRDAGEPFTGGFLLWVDSEEDIKDEKTIPVDLTDEFVVYIRNDLGYDSWFGLKLISPPEEAGCSLDETQLSIPNGGTDGVILTCSPTKYTDEYYAIEIKAWDGSISKIVYAKVRTGRFNVYVNEESVKESVSIIVGSEETFDVTVENDLGRDDVAFSLNINSFPDSNVNCNFDDTSTDETTVTVDDGEIATTTMRCKPTNAAKDKTYDVIVTAEYDVLKDDDIGIKITVPECDPGDLLLKFRNSNGDISVTNPLYSGDTFTLRATGFEGCDKLKGYFSVYEEGFKVDDCTLGGPNWNVCDLIVTANSPDTYTFYAFVDVDDDGITDASISKDLTINAGSPDANGYVANGKCTFWIEHVVVFPFLDTWNNICRDWPDLGTSAERCKAEDNDCLDPQTCRDRSAASVCCLDDKVCYCNGPDCDTDTGRSDVPCFSTDTETDRDSSEDFWWEGISGNRARNALVSDDKYAVFDCFLCHCHPATNDDCKIPDTEPLSEIYSATCVDFGQGIAGQCEIQAYREELGGLIGFSYDMWEVIRIAPIGSGGRNVYGIRIDGKFSGDGEVIVFIHNSTGWIRLSGGYYTPTSTESTKIIRPLNKWSWEGVDAILITLRLDLGHDSVRFDVDYIGLLTKGSDVPFCTDPVDIDVPDLEYYRVVDDGKTCYWDIDCDTEGYGYDSVKSMGVGPLNEFKCDCSSGTCGEGYCQDIVHGIDYYNVRCAHGGWRGDKV